MILYNQISTQNYLRETAGWLYFRTVLKTAFDGTLLMHDTRDNVS